MMDRKAIEVGDSLSGFIFIDEDFFIHEKRAMEFLDCVREGGVSPSIMGFGSVRGLSQFTANEIAEMGFDIIWTAFEGTNYGYKKLRKAFETLGPSLVRVMKTWFEGYLTMKSFSRSLLRQRAERMRGYVQSALPGIYPAIRFGPNRECRAETRQFLEDIVKEFGSLNLKKRLECWGTVPLSFWTWMKENLGLFQQPRLLRRKYRL
ncbi:MAG: hypothetical protein KJP23_13875 [Deltaproteobacteria bacterium]|nr:hypothetical protein [Deltaproteobacteria bacterium]